MICIYAVREHGGAKRVLWRQGPACAWVQGQQSEGKAHKESYGEIQASGGRGGEERKGVDGEGGQSPYPRGRCDIKHTGPTTELLAPHDGQH